MLAHNTDGSYTALPDGHYPHHHVIHETPVLHPLYFPSLVVSAGLSGTAAGFLCENGDLPVGAIVGATAAAAMVAAIVTAIFWKLLQLEHALPKKPSHPSRKKETSALDAAAAMRAQAEACRRKKEEVEEAEATAAKKAQAEADQTMAAAAIAAALEDPSSASGPGSGQVHPKATVEALDCAAILPMPLWDNPLIFDILTDEPSPTLI